MDPSIRRAILDHDRMVPRYTSYPAAPHFAAGLPQNQYAQWLAHIPAESPLSLYIHVPFCPRLCWFCGCNTRITGRYGPVQDYADLLRREVLMTRAAMPADMSIGHLHFGGGSPTILAPNDFDAFMSLLRDQFTFTDNADIAIEIDPRNVDDEKIKIYANAGVNRVSFGIQDFDDNVLAAVNRPQSYDLDARMIGACRDHGIKNINIDLMYGLPHQTRETMQRSAQLALTLDPDRISLFGYAHVPWMKKHMRLIDAQYLPNAELRLDLFDIAADIFERAGYIPIGIDHFVKPDDALASARQNKTLKRNFQGYTADQAQTLVGIGASAIGYIGNRYVQNKPALPLYRDDIMAGHFPADRFYELTPDDQIYGAIIEEIMCSLRANPREVMHAHSGTDRTIAEGYERLMPLVRDGLATLSDDGSITVQVRQAARLVAACFDQFMKPATAQDTPRHAVSV